MNNEMTKEEAIQKFFGYPILDILEVLGLIKFKEEEKPVFEVMSQQSGIHCRIWANGQIDGFPEGCHVINRIPQIT